MRQTTTLNKEGALAAQAGAAVLAVTSAYQAWMHATNTGVRTVSPKYQQYETSIDQEIGAPGAQWTAGDILYHPGFNWEVADLSAQHAVNSGSTGVIRLSATVSKTPEGATSGSEPSALRAKQYYFLNLRTSFNGTVVAGRPGWATGEVEAGMIDHERFATVDDGAGFERLVKFAQVLNSLVIGEARRCSATTSILEHIKPRLKAGVLLDSPAPSFITRPACYSSSVNAYPTYHPELAQASFYLGRHGESLGNAGTMAQGRGEDKPGEPNGLTPHGVMQVEAAVSAFAAAGFDVRYVSSSALTRAVESATVFIDASPDPKPMLAGEVSPGAEHGLKEISQKGWERIYNRERRARLYQNNLTRFMGKLSLSGELAQEDVEGYTAWIMRLGDEGESPLGGALRGVLALEEHGLRPGELVFSHTMLNRYMDAIATIVDSEGRERLRSLLDEQSVPESISRVVVIKALKELGIKDFKTHEHAANDQANGSAIEYTVEHTSGLWIPGRRIEPPKPGDKYPYIEHRRNAETAQWERVTPGGDNSSDNG